MGKIKQSKRISAHRTQADPILGGKMPLAEEIESLRLAKSKSGGSGANGAKKLDPKDQDEFINEKLSAKILHEARKQQVELEDELELDSDDSDEAAKPATKKGVSFLSKNESDSDSEDFENEYNSKREYYASEHQQQVEINEEDEKAFERFMSNAPKARRTIADIIMEKLTEKKTELQSQLGGDDDDNRSQQPMPELDERVVKVYTQLKEILQKYRSGKLPKAFKILPSLSNWEHILYLTDPDSWSAAAIYQATRIFASNLNAKMAQRFFSLALLPRIRDDIAEYKRLNFHLYMALKKALFKPAAFFKGILLPLCESRNCTLREAIIIGSILAKKSIPMLHSAAALLKIAEMEYSGANSIFIRILLDKKYALPYRVIDAVVFHFARFQNDSRELPVLWHQALLTFVQRYKSDISSEQKEALLELIKKHVHHEITGEIRRELMLARCRDLAGEEDDNSRQSIDFSNFDDNMN